MGSHDKLLLYRIVPCCAARSVTIATTIVVHAAGTSLLSYRLYKSISKYSTVQYDSAVAIDSITIPNESNYIVVQ